MRGLSGILLAATAVFAVRPVAAVTMDSAAEGPIARTTRAAVRTHATPTGTRQRSKVLSDARHIEVPPSLTLVVKRSTFDGVYVGAFGGFATAERQAGQPKVYGSTDSVVGPNGSITPVNFTRRLSSDAFGGALAGYGASTGALYLGVEVRAQLDDGRTAASGATQSTSTLPRLIQLLNGPAPFPPLPQVQPFDLTNYSVTRNTVEMLGGGDVSGRLGWIVDGNWMIFGRLGGGVSVIRETSRTSSASTTCNTPVVRRQIPSALFVVDSVIGCTSTSSAANTIKSSTNHLSPYLTFGLGVERNFGPYFARIEGEIQQHLGSARTSGVTYATAMSEPLFSHFYQLRLSGAVGYRW